MGVRGSGERSCESHTGIAVLASHCTDLCGTPVPWGGEPLEGGI